MTSWRAGVLWLLVLLCSTAGGAEDHVAGFEDSNDSDTDPYQNAQYRGNIPPFITVS